MNLLVKDLTLSKPRKLHFETVFYPNFNQMKTEEIFKLLLSQLYPSLKNKSQEIIDLFFMPSNVRKNKCRRIFKKNHKDIECLISLLHVLSYRYALDKLHQKPLLNNPQTIYKHFKYILSGIDHEEFWIVLQTKSKRVIEAERIEKGIVNKVYVYLRRIVERALYHQAAGVTLLHNHLSSCCFPSEKDIVLTSKIDKVLKSINIVLFDHIIVSRKGYFSLKEGSCMETDHSFS